MSRRRGRLRVVGGFLRRALFRNFWLKLLSLLFAVGFYAFIHSAQNAQRTLMVDLTVFLPPPGADRQLMTQLPTRISVTVQGLKSQLDTLRGEDLGPIAADLTEGTPRDYLFDETMLNLPPRVTVKRFVPSSLDLVWEDIVGRKIPVQVTLVGEPEPGYEVQGEPEIEPRTVEVRGPENLVNVIQFLKVTDYDVSGLTEGDHGRQLAINPPEELDVYDATYDVSNVSVTVRVGQTLETRTFERLKVEVVGLTRAVTRPSVVDVKVIGPPDRVQLLRPELVLPWVELEFDGAEVPKKGSVYGEVQVNIPGAEVEVTPAKVLVKW
ncbi:MAG: YbbR-like domain-containing protein [Deltaproteobacteria bacterium]|jgi:hypothetical protein|nr:YbbR-like domain-containing protein [Deltaproteobacteria bacterium]MBW2537838.1 YbbR-like domain-containing protein [Deltaproteobacteria bacterium]